MKRIFTFGQLGTMPVYAPKRKLEARADPARDMYPTSCDHVVVISLRTQQHQQIRAIDFQPYHNEQDPATTSTVKFKAKA